LSRSRYYFTDQNFVAAKDNFLAFNRYANQAGSGFSRSKSVYGIPQTTLFHELRRVT
jgi:hypothetical protein